MARPFDASLKDLVEQYPADWLRLVGQPTTAPIEVIDADLSTVTAATDKVIRVAEAEPWLLHLELQAGPDSGLPERLLLYNTLLRNRHRVRFRSVLVLLRRSADLRNLTGELQDQFPGEPPYLVFRYQCVRLWQIPVEAILEGGPGTLPLAPLVHVPAGCVAERHSPRRGAPG